MGGIGSGRKHGGPVTTDLLAIDVRSLQRHELLVPGSTVGAKPMRKTGHLPPVQLQVGVDNILLTLRKANEANVARGTTTRIRLERTPCHYGGCRVWFLCPCCGRRAAILYLGNTRLFACRNCRKLAYRSQRETEGKRVLRQVNKIRRTLGWPPGVIRGHGEKPKGMHWKTYLRYVKAHDYYAAMVLNQLSAQLGYLELQLDSMAHGLAA